MTGFIRGAAKIGGAIISHGDEAADVAKAGGAAAKLGDEAAEVGGRSLAGRAASGGVKGAGKVAKGIVDHPIRSAKAGILGVGAWEFGPELMAIGKKMHGVADAMTGPFLDENGELNGLGTAGLGVGALGAGAWAINKLKGDKPEMDQRPQLAAMGGAMPEAFDAQAAQEQYKKEHDFIPFNE